MTIFTYTPRVGADAKISNPVSIDFSEIEGYDNMNDILDEVSNGTPFYTPRDKDGTTPKNISLILFGKTDWGKIEALRRSSEFHSAVGDYSSANPEVETGHWKLSQDGRKPNGKSRTITFIGEIPSGKLVDGNSEIVQSVVNHKNGTATYSYTVSLKDVPIKDKVKTLSRGELEAEARRLAKEVEELKAAS